MALVEPIDAVLEVVLFGWGGAEFQCPRVSSCGLLFTSKAPQHLAARRMEVAVVAKRQRVQELECAGGSMKLTDGHRPVEFDDRRSGQLMQPGVEQGDLLPVARLLEVKIGDRGLQDVLP